MPVHAATPPGVCTHAWCTRGLRARTHTRTCGPACAPACRLCKKYPAVRDALLVSVLETVLRYNKAMAGIEVGGQRRGRRVAGACAADTSYMPPGRLFAVTAAARPGRTAHHIPTRLRTLDTHGVFGPWQQAGTNPSAPRALPLYRPFPTTPRPAPPARALSAPRRRPPSASATSTATSSRRRMRLWPRRRRGGQPCGRGRRARR